MKSIGSIWMNDSFYEIKENVDQSMHRHHSNVCYLDVSATTLIKPLTWRNCKIIHFLEQSFRTLLGVRRHLAVIISSRMFRFSPPYELVWMDESSIG